jgi:hypothetical protein
MGDNPSMQRTFEATRGGVLTLLLVVAGAAAAACGGSTTASPLGSAATSAAAPGAASSPTGSGPAATGPAAGTRSAAGTSSAPAQSVPAGTDGLPVAFKTGQASLTLTGSEKASVELGEVVPGENGSIFSGFDPVEGTSVSWREAGKAKGWYLSLTGLFGEGAVSTDEPIPFLSLTSPEDRYVQDMAGRCIVNVATSTREGVEGTIDCTGLAWLDEEDAPVGDPFDAKVTFAAEP